MQYIENIVKNSKKPVILCMKKYFETNNSIENYNNLDCKLFWLRVSEISPLVFLVSTTVQLLYSVVYIF